MSNIDAFYPQRLKGWALGLNAGGGNIGVAAVQLVGLAVLATAGAAHPRLILAVYIPLIILATAGAALYMDNLSQVRNEHGAMREVARDRHAWFVSFLYIGTFGSFIGFGFAFGQVLQIQFADTFDTPMRVVGLTFLGPLLGSLFRPVGGKLADHYRGSLVTAATFAGMVVGATLVLVASLVDSLPLFVGGFVSLFVLAGIGNGSTYKMIPAIFRAQADLAVEGGADADDAGRTRPPLLPGPDRHRRRGRRARWGRREPGPAPVVPQQRQRRRRLRGLHRLLRGVPRAHVGRLPAAVAPPPGRGVTVPAVPMPSSTTRRIAEPLTMTPPPTAVGHPGRPPRRPSRRSARTAASAAASCSTSPPTTTADASPCGRPATGTTRPTPVGSARRASRAPTCCRAEGASTTGLVRADRNAEHVAVLGATRRSPAPPRACGDVLDEHGPDAVALYVSGQMTIEAQYLANKLAKGFIGTNQIESNSRLCMASAGAGYKLSLGADGPPGSLRRPRPRRRVPRHRLEHGRLPPDPVPAAARPGRRRAPR